MSIKRTILKSKFKRTMNMNLDHIHILVDLRYQSYDINILYNIISNLKEEPISFHFVNDNVDSFYEICDYAIDLSDNPNVDDCIKWELPVLLTNVSEENKYLIEVNLE
jgi:hypothetical protein